MAQRAIIDEAGAVGSEQETRQVRAKRLEGYSTTNFDSVPPGRERSSASELLNSHRPIVAEAAKVPRAAGGAQRMFDAASRLASPLRRARRLRAAAGALFDFGEEPGEPAIRETELHVARGDVALCFLLNRRTQVMRVIDFRSGCQEEKKSLVEEVARVEEMRRAFVVVEREEAVTWSRCGFEKEGTIPGFYKRSDGVVLGREFEEEDLCESGVRIRVASRGRRGQGASTEPASAQQESADRLYQLARKVARKAPPELPKVRVAPARAKDIEKATRIASQNARMLTQFEPFGRGVELKHEANLKIPADMGGARRFLCTARGGFSLLVGVETQHCFDNAFLDVLSPPRGEKEIWLTASGFLGLAEELLSEGVVTTFAIAPAPCVELGAALAVAGFRRTAYLSEHLLYQGKPTDGVLWSLKLAEPR